MKIGYVGVGAIGHGIAGNLIKHGHELTIYDIADEAMAAFEGRAMLAKNAAEVIRNSEVVFFSLPRTEDVEATVHEMIAEGVQGKMIIDASTSYPFSTKKLYEEIKANGGTMIDAPLMAGPAEAEAGILEIVVGGEKEDFERAEELFKCYCASYRHMGPIGTGHMLKIAMNFAGLTEALLFAQLFPVMEKAGIEKKVLFDAIEGAGIANWVSNFYNTKYVNRDYHLDFKLQLGTKDLSYLKRIYEQFNVPAFILDGALEFCRVSLADQKPGEPAIDFSYPCETMYRLLEK